MVSEDVSKSVIDTHIYLVRGVSVMLDVDLAGLYGVSPGALIQAVRRNRNRFPADFLFQLTNHELTNLKSQSVISSFGGNTAEGAISTGRSPNRAWPCFRARYAAKSRCA